MKKSKQPIAIIGAGGFGREVVQLIKDINQVTSQWEVLGFIDDNPDLAGTAINDLPVLGGLDWLKDHPETQAILAVGSPQAKQAMVQQLAPYHLTYPNLIHPRAVIGDDLILGEGNIITAGVILTVNIRLGSHLSIHTNATIGHDSVVEDYGTILPNASIAGNVTLHEGVLMGANATIIQQLDVAAGTVIGAGATVVRSIPEACTVVGTPAQSIR